MLVLDLMRIDKDNTRKKITQWGVRNLRSMNGFENTLVFPCNEWNHRSLFILKHFRTLYFDCRNPTLRECEDETHTPEIGTWESFGTWESSGTLKTLQFDCRGQNTLHWIILYIVGKLSKCRCRK